MRFLLASALAGAILLTAAAPAGAFNLGGSPWPGTTITFHTQKASYSKYVRRAARAWNRQKVGIRFKRASAGEADVLLKATGPACSGESSVGYLGRGVQSVVFLGAGCGGGILTLAAAHELGHILGLDHEHHRCALLNVSLDADTGTPRHCHRHSLRFWLKHPIRKDDVRGARRLYS